MKKMGVHNGRTSFWLDYPEFQTAELPKKDWLVLAICASAPDTQQFELFARLCIDNDVQEFKGAGSQGELLHDLFDSTIVSMEVFENRETQVMTTWHNDETLADAFWQCHFATCLRETTDFDNVTILCTDLDGQDRSDELHGCLQRFEAGWLPEG